MRDLPDLLAHRFDHFGAGMPDGSREHAAETIQISIPLGVPYVHTFAAFKHQRMFVIGRGACPYVLFLFCYEISG